MDEEVLNLQIRKFLKKVGVNSQRVIEQSIREALESNLIDGTGAVSAAVTLRIPELGVEVEINDQIALE